jgi:hypothetical protein
MNARFSFAGTPPQEVLHDVLRGVAQLTGNGIVADLARVVEAHPEADLSPAFSHKQIASKQWLLDSLFATLGGYFAGVTVLGGWYGVLPAMLLADPRFSIKRITSVDIDPACAAIAGTLNGRFVRDGRFAAVTADMHALDYASPDALIINTSCEHIPDVRRWLDLLPPAQQVVLQSNDFFAEPSHVSCMVSLDAFVNAARLARLDFAGSFASKRYTRFMLIGAR